ncbi:nucleotide sugar dehydrogenase [Methanocaldococcus sp.]
MKICVLGLGYIGLPTAAMLAIHNNDVVGVDINNERLEEIKKLDFAEVDLKSVVSAALNSNKLKLSNKPEKADAYIICVPTPIDESKRCDLSYLKKAIEDIKPYLEDDNLIIIESTVPPGTTEEIYKELSKEKNIFMAYCPERVLPGNILRELIENDRVIGGINRESSILAKKVYECFVKGKLYLTDAKTAEMVKLMENTYRDVNIALANEFAKICEELKINVWEAIKLANNHPRVNILNPGPGVGGHCIPVDPWFIVEKSKEAKLIKVAREVNDSMPLFVVNKIKKIVDNGNISILGVAYKGNVDDIRESPALKIVEELLNLGYSVKCHDPKVKKFKYKLYNLRECLKDSDLIVILADHEEYKNLPIKEIGELVRSKNILDTRNIIDREEWERFGFKTYLLGDGNET